MLEHEKDWPTNHNHPLLCDFDVPMVLRMLFYLVPVPNKPMDCVLSFTRYYP